MNSSVLRIAVALVACLSLVSVLTGCKEANNEQTSSSFQKLAPDEAKKRLGDTLARHSGKMAPVPFRTGPSASTP